MNDVTVNIKRCQYTNKDFIFLISHLDNELNDRFGNQRAVYDKYNKVDSIQTVIVTYVNNIPVGCGCFKPFDKNTIEIKRIFVEKEYRRKGISKLILSELEKWAIELGYLISILETGEKLTEAIGLYKNSGYVRIENYGQYKDFPQSICFEKILKSK